jgi:hypothetical protein
MSAVTLSGKQIIIDGIPRTIRSGAVHYWGLDRQYWPLILDKAKAAHFNAVEAYTPWFWHEPGEGTFDFTGKTDPGRDLVGFLRLVAERGLYFIARPGPFINSEVRNGGHPAWLLDDYPELLSHRCDGGTAFWVGQGQKVPSQLHPLFLEKVRRWYEAVVPVLSGFSIEKGGPVILFQPDNEINLCFSFGLFDSLYDDHILEPEKGLWRQWLRSEAGRQDYLAPPDFRKPETLDDERQLLWLKFKQWHMYRYVQLLAESIRALGLELPYVLNEPTNKSWAWGEGDHASAKRYLTEHRQNAFTAAHTYLYGGEMDVHGVAAMVSRMAFLQMGQTQPVMGIESGAGWFRFGNMIRAEYNWELNMKCLIGQGMDSFNIYPLSDRINPGDAGISGRYYRFLTMLSEQGDERDVIYDTVKDAARFLESWEGELLVTHRHADVEIGLYTDLHLLANPQRDYAGVAGSEQYAKTAAAALPDNSRVRAVFNSVAELFKLLVVNNINPACVDLAEPSPELAALADMAEGTAAMGTELAGAGTELAGAGTELAGAGPTAGSTVGTELAGELAGGLSGRPAGTVLIVPNTGKSPDFVSRRIQEALADGRTVVLYPDAAGLSGSEFAGLTVDALPVPGFQAGDTVYRTVSAEGLDETPIHGVLNSFSGLDKRQDRPLLFHKGQPVALERQLARGRLIILGFMPQYLTEGILPLFTRLFKDDIGIRTRVVADRPGLLTTARGGDNGLTFITLLNHGGVETSTVLTLAGPGGVAGPGGQSWRIPRQGRIFMPGKSAKIIMTGLETGHGKLLYCTEELVRGANPDEFVIKGAPAGYYHRAFESHEGHVAFDRDCVVYLDGTRLALVRQDDAWLASFALGSVDRLLRLE